jgi:hypothetical protein
MTVALSLSEPTPSTIPGEAVVMIVGDISADAVRGRASVATAPSNVTPATVHRRAREVIIEVSQRAVVD